MQSFVNKAPNQRTLMNDERVIRITAAELPTLQDVTDWDRVDALTDAQIGQAISEDPDAAPILDEEFWKRAKILDPPELRNGKSA